MKTRIFSLATLLLLVLLSASSTSLARQDQQERSKKAGDAADAEPAGPMDVVDGKFNKTLPVVLSLQICGGAMVELKGSCHIQGTIEAAEDSRNLVALDAGIDLSGIDESSGTPYTVSLVRHDKFKLRSKFSVVYYQNPSEGKNVTSFTLGLKFEDGRISLASVKAKDCL
jgi:hypothetical protein